MWLSLLTMTCIALTSGFGEDDAAAGITHSGRNRSQGFPSGCDNLLPLVSGVLGELGETALEVIDELPNLGRQVALLRIDRPHRRVGWLVLF